MALLKLAYIAHGWSLGLSNVPLIRNRIEAWKFGPVVPDIYHAFRPHGIRPTRPDQNHPCEIESAEGKDFLEQIYDIYGNMTPSRLSELTHVPGGPWETAIKWGGQYAEIPNDLTRAHYLSKLQVTNETARQ